MDVKWEPKISGTTPAIDAEPKPDLTPAAPHATAEAPQGMEKPKTVPLPDAAQTHPTKSSPTARPSPLDLEVERLRALLQTGARAKAARAALGLAASSRLRRSRGARAKALELCDDVAGAVEELRTLALRLRELLTAEGELHDTSAVSTLAACRRLIALVDDDGDPS